MLTTMQDEDMCPADVSRCRVPFAMDTVIRPTAHANSIGKGARLEYRAS